MKSSAYILGALDALVKAGEISDAYASGVISVLEKDAGLFGDTSFSNTAKAYAEWQRQNPGKQITGEEARKIMRDNAHNWYNIGSHDNAGFGTGIAYGAGKAWNSIRNGISKLTGCSGIRSDYTNEMRDRAYEDAQNRGQVDRLKDWESKGMMLPAEFAAALQDEHIRNANNVVEDSKAHMGASERQAKGLDDRYEDQYKTTQGNLAVSAGQYKPQHFKGTANTISAPGYGRDVSSQYGARKDLVYNRNYFDPTAI